MNIFHLFSDYSKGEKFTQIDVPIILLFLDKDEGKGVQEGRNVTIGWYSNLLHYPLPFRWFGYFENGVGSTSRASRTSTKLPLKDFFPVAG